MDHSENKTICKLFLVFWFFLLVISLQGKNYYIDPINGNMSNDGSYEMPWSRLDSVALYKINELSGGDTLFLRNGFHGDNVRLDKTPNKPIVVIAQNSEKPILLNFTINASNWVLDGLTFTRQGNDGSGVPGQFYNGTYLTLSSVARNNVIQNCTFYSIDDASNWTLQDWRSKVWNGIMDYGKNNLIKNNHIFNIAFAIQLMQQCDSTAIEGNIINNFSGDGIRIAGADYCRIENNVIKNSVELDANPTDGNHEDGIQAWDFDDGVNGLIIRGNFILNYDNLDRPFRGLMQGIGFFDGFYNNCIIENNVIIVEHWHGISLYGAKDCRIINNTVLPNPGGSNQAGPPWIGIFAHKDGRNSTGNIVRNNLATKLSIENGSAAVDHNVIDPAAMNFCRDYENFDFYPQPDITVNGKSIIDTGSSDLAPSIDFYGISRPQGAGFDIGAYEYIDSILAIDKEDKKNILKGYVLHQNFPNPFNPSTIIKYTLARSGKMILLIYDNIGREVKRFVRFSEPIGENFIVWDGMDNSGKPVSSGLYFYRIKSGKFIQTRKMLLIR